MARNGNGLPPPDAHLIVVVWVIWAVAVALGAQRGERFITTLAEQARSEEARRRVVWISATDGRRRQVTQSVQGAARFVERIVAELRAARG